MVLYYVFDLLCDWIFFDVGYQVYVYKILIGWCDQMVDIKKEGGISGFIKVFEFEYDVIMVGYVFIFFVNVFGMVFVCDVQGKDFYVVVVIGDGLLIGGMVFVVFNIIGDMGCKMLIVFNDNEMSILENVGVMNKFMCGL